jgi:beta-barrel assembly-enhancing protease
MYSNRETEERTASPFRLDFRLVLALIIAGISVISYLTATEYNPITHQKQHVDISPDQEIVLGLQSAPTMEQRYGGLSSNSAAAELVSSVGGELISKSDAAKSPYEFAFHLLADPTTVNAFALPGGQIFITEGLAQRLKSSGQLASVLAHEIGHVIARHAAQHLAKQELIQGLTGAAVIATYDPNDPSSRNKAAMAALLAEVINLKFSRHDELEADKLGVKIAAEADYDPRSMIKVMKILEQIDRSRSLEFFSTHPNPEHRIANIETAINEDFPKGVPTGLKE